MNYKEVFLRVAEEGYDAGKLSYTHGAVGNPYDFLKEHLEYTAYQIGYEFYCYSVH